MAVQESITVNAPLDRVVEAFASEDFARFVCEKLGIGFENFTVSGPISGAFTATTNRSVGADKIPDIAKKFVSKGLTMEQSDRVSEPNAEAGRTVTSEIKVTGLPLTATATQNLVAQGEKTVIDLSGQVSCGIPLVGKKIAAAAEPYVGRVLSKLASYVEEWTAKN